jgi:hypothetical protein
VKAVYESQFAVEAHMILHLLQSARIDGQVLGEHLQGGAGELPVAGLVRVVVADEQESHARKLIAEWERSQPPPDPTLAPSSPGRPALALAFIAGAVAGALATLWAILR